MSARALYIFVGYYFTLMMFGLFGLALSLLALAAGLLPASPRIERLFQNLIHWNLALFLWWTRFARLFVVRYHGFDALAAANERGLIVVANHPDLVDITCLLARLPRAICIFKSAIRRNPVLGAAARRAGYTPNDRGHEMVRSASEKLGNGQQLVIFPEGTRTPPGETLLPFKPGFLLIAKRAQVPVQLVRIVNERPVLGKGQASWKLPPLPGRADLHAGPKLEIPADADIATTCAEIENWFRSGVVPTMKTGPRAGSETRSSSAVPSIV